MQTTFGEAEERARLRRLGDEDVDAGAGDLARLERRREILLDHQTAAGAVDDADAVLHLGDRRRVDDVAGLVGERRVQRDEVGAAEELVELDLVDAELRWRAPRDRKGSKAITFICRPIARSATIEPILPQPMMPSVLP